jgi:hypothetical protein
MVFPIQIVPPNPPGVPEGPPLFNIPSTEVPPSSPETVSSIGTFRRGVADEKDQQTPPSNTSNDAPRPGEVVDKSVNHKEEIATLSTPDTTTLRADEEENDFIPKVEEAHDTAHEQHR